MNSNQLLNHVENLDDRKREIMKACMTGLAS